MTYRGLILGLAAAVLPLLTSCRCGDSVKERSASSGAASTLAPRSEDERVAGLRQRGRTVYLTNCTACHHTNPKVPGSVGPEIFGSSRELLEARIVHGAYPAGYSPKRTTKAMAALPYLKNDVEAVYYFLNTP